MHLIHSLKRFSIKKGGGSNSRSLSGFHWLLLLKVAIYSQPDVESLLKSSSLDKDIAFQYQLPLEEEKALLQKTWGELLDMNKQGGKTVWQAVPQKAKYRVTI